MAKPGLLVDSGALIALANRRETANQAVNRVLGDFFGELVTTWPAVTEACHMIPDHLAPVLLAWLGGPRWRVLGMDGAAPRLSDLMRKYADRPMQIAGSVVRGAGRFCGHYANARPTGRSRARGLGLVLVTNDKSEFLSVPGLMRENWA